MTAERFEGPGWAVPRAGRGRDWGPRSGWRCPRRAGCRRTWEHADAALTLLRAHAVGLCVHDMPGSAIARAAIGTAIYVRFHGPTGQYSGSYGAAALQPWAEWIAGAHRDGHDVHGYFNHDIGGHAIGDAERLRAAVARMM